MRAVTIVPGGETPTRQFPIGPSTRKTAQNPFETHSSDTQEQGTGRSPIKLSLPRALAPTDRSPEAGLRDTGQIIGRRCQTPHSEPHCSSIAGLLRARVETGQTSNTHGLLMSHLTLNIHVTNPSTHDYSISLISKMNSGMFQAILKIEIMPL